MHIYREALQRLLEELSSRISKDHMPHCFDFYTASRCKVCRPSVLAGLIREELSDHEE